MQAKYEESELLYKNLLTQTLKLELEFRILVSLVNLNQHLGHFYQAFSYGIQLTNSKYASLPEDLKANATIAMVLSLMDSALYNEASLELKKTDFSNLSQKVQCTALYLKTQIVYRSQSWVWPEQELVDEARQCLENDQALYALLSNNALAFMWLESENPEKALDVLLEKKEQAHQFGYMNLSLVWHAGLLKAFLQKKDVTSANVYGQQLVELLEQHSESIPLEVSIVLYQGLADWVKLNGQSEQALAYTEQLFSTYKRTYDKQQSAALAYHAALMQAAERNLEIDRLNQSNRQLLLEAELHGAEAETQRLYLVLISCILVMTVLFIYRSQQERRRLKRRVTFDKLTGVYSRDYFEELLHAELARTSFQQQELGLILFDLDFFKAVNDTFGHPTGDWVLQKTAKAAQECLRTTDFIGRLGGEEFAIVLPNCTLEQSIALAETVRVAIESLELTQGKEVIAMTASFGVCTANEVSYNVRKLMAVADEALYEAKRSGRNQVKPEPSYQEWYLVPSQLQSS